MKGAERGDAGFVAQTFRLARDSGAPKSHEQVKQSCKIKLAV